MRNTSLWAIGCIVAVVAIGIGARAASVPAAALAVPSATLSDVTPAPAPTASDYSDIVLPDTEDSRRNAVREYVQGVMEGWSPARIDSVPLEELAADIAAVATADEPAWPSDKTGAKSAVLLAGLAYFEGARFAMYVDNGTCNEPGFREHNPLARYGTCDNGHAHSLWQVHEIQLHNPDETASAASLSDRRFAAHIALRLARQSLAATGTLRNYTGEWSGECPKADVRLRFVEKALAAHPFDGVLP